MAWKRINSLADKSDDDIAELIMRHWGHTWGGSNGTVHILTIYLERPQNRGAPEAPHHLEIGNFINAKRQAGISEPTAREMAFSKFAMKHCITEDAIRKIYRDYYQQKQVELLKQAIIYADMYSAIQCVRNLLDTPLRSLGLLDT